MSSFQKVLYPLSFVCTYTIGSTIAAIADHFHYVNVCVEVWEREEEREREEGRERESRSVVGGLFGLALASVTPL